MLTLTDTFKDGQLVTGGCCQWRGSPSYDSDEHVGIVVLRRKFSDEPPNSTPPGVNLHQLEADRHIQLYPDFFAILAAGFPVGHGADHP